MLPPQLCALALLASCVDAALVAFPASDTDVETDIDVKIGVNVEHKLQCQVSLPEILESRIYAVDHGTDITPICEEDIASTVQSVNQCDSDIPATSPNFKQLSLPTAHGLIDIDRLLQEADVEAGARDVIAKTGAYHGGPDLAGAEKMFGPVTEIQTPETDKKYGISALAKPIIAITLDMFHVHRKLQASLMNTYLDSDKAWIRSMRLAAHVLKSDAPGGSLTLHSRNALVQLISSLNNVLTNSLHSMYLKFAANINNSEIAKKSGALFIEEKRRYEEYL